MKDFSCFSVIAETQTQAPKKHPKVLFFWHKKTTPGSGFDHSGMDRYFLYFLGVSPESLTPCCILSNNSLLTESAGLQGP